MVEPRNLASILPSAKLTRRDLFKTAAVAGAALVAPAVIPASALGRGGAVAPSERIVMGGIGLRGRGMGDLGWLLPEADVQFVAICDAQKSAREKVPSRRSLMSQTGICGAISASISQRRNRPVP